jgi:hypothetical protein
MSGDIAMKDAVVKSCFDQIQAFEDRFVFVKPPKEGFVPWYDSLMRVYNLPHYLDIETPDPFVMQNRYTTDDGSEMFFIINSHRYQSHQTKITFHRELTHHKYPWVWNLHTGDRYPLILNEDDSYDFDLGPAESVLIVFERKKSSSASLQKVRNDSCHCERNSVERGNPVLPETADLSNDWDVEFIHTRLDTAIRTHFDTLFDLKDRPETQHFAGTIVYRKTIQNQGNILDLGLVEGVSEVFVNGQSAGVRYYGRRLCDIGDMLHNGDNDLEIRVTTTLGNYLKTFTKEDNPTVWVYVNHPKRDQPLQPAGMIGPVKLIKNH